MEDQLNEVLDPPTTLTQKKKKQSSKILVVEWDDCGKLSVEIFDSYHQRKSSSYLSICHSLKTLLSISVKACAKEKARKLDQGQMRKLSKSTAHLEQKTKT